MRKLLIALLIAILLAALWLWQGRGLVALVDRCTTVQVASSPVRSISFENIGKNGMLDDTLIINGQTLPSMPSAKEYPHPSFGTTKQNEFAVSCDGKVFAFGATESSDNDQKLTSSPRSGDEAFISARRSLLPWPNLFDMNFMTGKSPSWRRYQYRRLVWTHQDGARLEMMWRYEQYFYSGDGWLDGLMTRERTTGLIRVEISSASR